MQHDQKQLHQIAQDYLCHMFTVEEIALLCNVSRDVVSKARGAADSPFFMNKCRPEWFLEWMRLHPNFQLTKEYLPSLDRVAAKNPAKGISPVDAPKRIKKLRTKSLAVA
jgi:hypothetical protein